MGNQFEIVRGFSIRLTDMGSGSTQGSTPHESCIHLNGAVEPVAEMSCTGAGRSP